jgi:hypothetical protein
MKRAGKRQSLWVPEDLHIDAFIDRPDERRRLKMARTQEHDTHARIGWEV